MKVYALIEGIPYEGENLYGVFSTLELANLACEEKNKTTKYKRRAITESGEYYFSDNPDCSGALYVETIEMDKLL